MSIYGVQLIQLILEICFILYKSKRQAIQNESNTNEMTELSQTRNGINIDLENVNNQIIDSRIELILTRFRNEMNIGKSDENIQNIIID